MKITIPEPTTTITKGEMAVEADEFTVEAPVGTFTFYLRADGALAIYGGEISVGAVSQDALVLRVKSGPKV